MERAWSFCGKGVTDGNGIFCTSVNDSCGLSRPQLASTICESLGWVRANERNPGNVTSTSILLEARGLVELPRPVPKLGPREIDHKSGA